MADPTTDFDQIEARLARWRRTGDIDALWPDVPYAARRAALGQIVATTRTLLMGPGPAARLTDADSDARALGVAAFTAGMGPLLGWWIEQGQLAAPPHVRDVLARHLDHGRRRSALLRSHAGQVAASMHAHGASPVLLKGLHTGAEFFPDPATRPAADIDFLVDPAERERAGDALRALGYVETRRTRFAARSEWTLRDASRTVRSLEIDHAENPWSVDLHVALERWYFRGVRRSLGREALDTSRRIVIDGTPVRVLDQPYLTAFLALHGGYDLAQLQTVRILDLVLATRADAASGRMDWSEVSACLARSDTARFAYPAFALAEALVPGCIDRSALANTAADASPRMRAVVGAVERAQLGPLQQRGLDTKLVWSVGARELLLNLSEVALPSDDGMGGWALVLRRRLASLERALRGAKRSVGP